MEKTSSPLLVIGALIALSEAVGIAGVLNTTGTAHTSFVVFTISFTFFVAVVFFLLLWKKPYLLFSPDQFKGANEIKYYIDAVNGNQNSTETANEYRAIFLIKRSRSDNSGSSDSVLVYASHAWQCYMFCNARYDPNKSISSQLPELKEKLSNRIGVGSESILLSYADNADTSNIKYSYSSKKDTKYHYKFIFVNIRDLSKHQHLSKNKFVVAGYTYTWATLGQLRAHKDTVEKNSDVIYAVSENFHSIQRIPCSF